MFLLVIELVMITNMNTNNCVVIFCPSGQNMLKLFIIGNTLLIIVTFAWPHIRDTAATIRSLMLE